MTDITEQIEKTIHSLTCDSCISSCDIILGNFYLGSWPFYYACIIKIMENRKNRNEIQKCQCCTQYVGHFGLNQNQNFSNTIIKMNENWI